MNCRAAVSWFTRWETTLLDEEHTVLSSLLASSFRSSASLFAGGRSWAGARPELRIVGRRGSEPRAHAALIRRFLRADGHPGQVLVGDVGLVAVHPEERGTGLGAQLMRQLVPVLERLALPYGFLTCDAEVQPFYARCGWQTLNGTAVHWVSIRGTVDSSSTKAMVLPVLRPVSDLPPGPYRRNGQEL